jgi:hypothetical protein
MRTVTANVFAKAGTKISCEPLVGDGVDTNILTIGDATVFADRAALERISDVIEGRLIEIVNEKHELIVEPDPAEAARFAEEQAREARGELDA